VALLSGREMQEMLEQQMGKLAGGVTPITPEDHLVDVLKGKVLDVKSAQSLLGRAGIPSLIAGDSSSCGKGCCGPEVCLQVRAADIPEVMSVLAREHIKATGLDDHDISLTDVVFDPEAGTAICPACGCNFSTRDKTCPDCGLCF
jgi:hypothetical protein